MIDKSAEIGIKKIVPINKGPIKTSQRPEIQSQVEEVKASLKPQLAGTKVNEGVLTHLARQNVAQTMREQKLKERAQTAEKHMVTDVLTGLPNRREFETRLRKEVHRAGRLGTNTMVLFMDLNFFKEINDTLGHHAGDAELIRVTNLLRETTRPDFDTVARIGGDEFTFILPNMDEEQLQKWWEKRANFILSQGNVSAGIGAAMITAQEASDAQKTEKVDQLIATKVKQADEAMYKAKEAAKREAEEKNRRNISVLQIYKPTPGEVLSTQ